MTAGELAILLAAVLCSIGFAALVVVLVRVLDALRALREEVTDLRAETRPLLAELRQTTDDARATVDEARSDLERFDRVLGSAEAIGDAVAGTSVVARTAFSAPMIKLVGLAKGTSRTVSRLRSGPEPSPPAGAARPTTVIEIESSNRRRRRRA
jgi:ABC-type transporter Mla subunit MlaD